VVPATLEVLERRFGIGTADLRVYCGPAIGRCCYRVGDEVVEQFAARPPFDRDDSWLHRLPAGCRLDLVRLQLLQLWACGLPREGVSVLSACTACDNFFFSYRRDRGITGRQIAFAGLVGAAG
jgi:copper oxidase (laccase) domain-containing protein